MASDQYNEPEIELSPTSRLSNGDGEAIISPVILKPKENIPIPPMVISNLQLISSALAGGAASMLLEQAKVRTANLSDANKTDLNKMKEEFGLGLSTQILIANRTHWHLELVDYINFTGTVWKYPIPTVIEHHKVGVFLHVRRNFRLSGSSGGLCYVLDGPNGRESRLDIMWNNPSIGQNWVLVRLSLPDDPIDWRAFRKASLSSNRRDFASAINKLVTITACIGQSTTSFLEICLHENIEKPGSDSDKN